MIEVAAIHFIVVVIIVTWETRQRFSIVIDVLAVPVVCMGASVIHMLTVSGRYCQDSWHLQMERK